MDNNRENRYLTITQAAGKLGVSRQTIYTWIGDGRIKTIKTPSGRLRIRENQLILADHQEERVIEDKNDSFGIEDISELTPYMVEQMGTKEKYWFWVDAENWYWDIDGDRFLFKSGRVNTGENWAEVIAAELCSLLGLPHAKYKLARFHELNGVITPNFVEDNSIFIPGNELLAGVVKGYEKTKRYKQFKHTLRTVATILKNPDFNITEGIEITADINCALDVFAGYLIFDAWIANTDRHHENWGVIYNPNKRSFSLAPTFDHAASLGRNEQDDTRRIRLDTKDKTRSIVRYVEKARSALYKSISDNKPMLTLETIKEIAKIRPGAVNYWQNKLQNVLVSDTVKIVYKIPDEVMSDTSKEFAIKLLELNRDRILGLNFQKERNRA